MKKTIFQVVVTTLIWCIAWLPFWLPDHITGYHAASGESMDQPYKLWAAVTILLCIWAGWGWVYTQTDKLYEWLRK